MSIEDQLNEVTQLHPWKSKTLVELQFNQLTEHYGCPQDIALAYLQYHYTSERPRHFLMWYAEHHSARDALVKSMTQPRVFSGTTPNPLKTGYE